MRKPVKSVVVGPNTWRLATRSRKAAVEYATVGRVRFLGMSAAGRAKRWDDPGPARHGDIDIYLVPMRLPDTRPGVASHVRNLAGSYIPGLVRLAWEVWQQPAEIVHVTYSALAPLGVLHRLRYHSSVVLDLTERPGEVVAAGSLVRAFSMVERGLLRLVAPWVRVVTVPVAGTIGSVKELGFRRVLLLRNAPLREWRAEYRDPHSSPGGRIDIAVIGSVFEGRGYEILIRALEKVLPRRPVRVLLAGPGRDEYVESLRSLAEHLGVDTAIEWIGTIDSDDVSATYLRAHVGLVLYESLDPGNDGLSNKILECVATGRPVLAGDLPENRRFVTENGVGFLTGVTVEELAESLLRLPSASELVELSRRCRRAGGEWLYWEAEFGGLLAELGLRSPTSDPDGDVAGASALGADRGPRVPIIGDPGLS